MKFENTSVMNFENAIRGARNPLESWAKSDSYINDSGEFVFGENDFSLAKRLCVAGNDHRKFMRQIFVSVDITAPIYWWKEQETYKVGTVSNSTSTMHRLTSTPITVDCFELSDYSREDKAFLNQIEHLEEMRKIYTILKDKKIWKALIEQLPESWLQTRTCTMNYENLINMYHARKNHKLTEWRVDFCNWVESLPYSELITGKE